MKSPIIFLFVFLLINILPIFGQKPNHLNTIENQNNIQGIPFRTKFNINNISTWIYNNGDADIKPDGNSGFQYPKGSNKALVFESGIVWGGKVNGEIRVGGSTYEHGLLPGRILPNGERELGTDGDGARIFRVRLDWKSGDLSSELNDGEGTEAEIRAQYELDWNEWPAEFGAPFDDIDKDGFYNSSVDIPGIPKADQTIWYVANDLDIETCRSLYGSDPMGIEFQVTIWGYKNLFPQNNIMYKSYKLINKSSSDFESMYISQWADTDIGDGGDDYVGCDTSLALAYAYNGDDYDATYHIMIPVIGFQLMQGPIRKDRLAEELQNLSMSSFIRLLKNSNSNFDDPSRGDYEYGTLPIYNFMQGKGTNGEIMIDPITGKQTKYAVPGDPITKEGWIEENDFWHGGDRRLMISTGPFTMAAGDTQEVIIAEIAALGKDRFSSIQLLKSYSAINLNTELKIDQPELLIPKVKINEWGAAKEVELEFLNRNELLKYDHGGYKFQGINLYLSTLDLNTNVKTIKKTYDVIDGIKEIEGSLVNNGKTIFTIKEIGDDTGIPFSFILDKDPSTQSPLIPGKEYYYNLSAYYVDQDTDLKVFETFFESNSFTYLRDKSLIQYGDTILSLNKWENNPYVNIRTVNPYILETSEYEIIFHENQNEFYFDLLENKSGSTIIDKGILYDFNTKHGTEFKQELNGYLLKVGFRNGIFSFNSGRNIEEIYLAGDKNTNPVPVWSYYSERSYSIENSTPWGENSDSLIKYVQYTRPYDYEIRFNDKLNYGLQFFSTGKIISVPFELWNIGIDSPDDNSDDVRMIPFISEYEERDFWGFSDSVKYSIRDHDFIYWYPRSDEIFWMFPDQEAGGYTNFAAKCTERGIGEIYDLSQDNSPQGYYVDFKGDTSYAIGNMIFAFYYENVDPTELEIWDGTIIRFTSTENLDGLSYTFNTSKVENPQISFGHELFQNYPNPFNPNTKIRYYIPEDGNVKITIYNILGQKVTEAINKNVKAGKYETEFNGSNLASGVYIYRIEVDSPTKSNIYSQTKKMILLK